VLIFVGEREGRNGGATRVPAFATGNQIAPRKHQERNQAQA